MQEPRYNWGGYFETVKECLQSENKPITWKNFIQVDSVFELLQYLEKSKYNRNEILKFPKVIKCQNKLNSKVLDGILGTLEYAEDLECIKYAIWAKQLEAVKFYMDRFPEFTQLVDYLFSYSVRYGTVEILQYFLDYYEADLYAKDENEKPYLLKITHNFEIFKFLYEKGLNSKELLEECMLIDNIEILEFILKQGVPLEKYNVSLMSERPFCETIKHIANNYDFSVFKYNLPDIMQNVVDNDNADLLKIFVTKNIVETRRLPSVLISAVEMNSVKIIDYLLECKTPVDFNSFECIRVALEKNDTKMAKMLMNYVK